MGWKVNIRTGPRPVPQTGNAFPWRMSWAIGSRTRELFLWVVRGEISVPTVRGC